MKWTVLSDNRSKDSSLITEHGLSIFLQTERHKILLDTGASDVFIRNAELLDIDLCDVDYVFSITTEWPEIDENRLILIDQTCEIEEDIHVIAHIPQNHPMPKGNQNLYVQDVNGDYNHDDFRHELALYVDGLLFTGCAHSGLENILAACPWPVHTVVGGFHLLDGMEPEEELIALALRLKTNYLNTKFYTSHCTGDNVFEVMKGVMGEQLQSFSCGNANLSLV